MYSLNEIACVCVYVYTPRGSIYQISVDDRARLFTTVVFCAFLSPGNPGVPGIALRFNSRSLSEKRVLPVFLYTQLR